MLPFWVPGQALSPLTFESCAGEASRMLAPTILTTTQALANLYLPSEKIDDKVVMRFACSHKDVK